MYFEYRKTDVDKEPKQIYLIIKELVTHVKQNT